MRGLGPTARWQSKDMVLPAITIPLAEMDRLLEVGPDGDTVLEAGGEAEAPDEGFGRGGELWSRRAQDSNGTRIDGPCGTDHEFQVNIPGDPSHDKGWGNE